MPRTTLFISILGLLAIGNTARADYMVDFVRIGCVPGANFFDIEHRLVHNNPAESVDKLTWAKQGYHSPSNLSHECSLDHATYKVMATQDSWRDRGFCAAAPEVILTIERNGDVIADKIVFGSSCFGNPTITRISIAEERHESYTMLSEICFRVSGKSDERARCSWFLGRDGFGRAFPLRMAGLADQLRKWDAE